MTPTYSVPSRCVASAAAASRSLCPACRRSNVPPTETFEKPPRRETSSSSSFSFFSSSSKTTSDEPPVASSTTTSFPSGRASASARARARFASQPHSASRGVNSSTGATRAMASHADSKSRAVRVKEKTLPASSCASLFFSSFRWSAPLGPPSAAAEAEAPRNSTSKWRRSATHASAAASTRATSGGEPTRRRRTPPSEASPAEDISSRGSARASGCRLARARVPRVGAPRGRTRADRARRRGGRPVAVDETTSRLEQSVASDVVRARRRRDCDASRGSTCFLGSESSESLRARANNLWRSPLIGQTRGALDFRRTLPP